VERIAFTGRVFIVPAGLAQARGSTARIGTLNSGASDFFRGSDFGFSRGVAGLHLRLLAADAYYCRTFGLAGAGEPRADGKANVAQR
jgi:hypothetical protein